MTVIVVLFDAFSLAQLTDQAAQGSWQLDKGGSQYKLPSICRVRSTKDLQEGVLQCISCYPLQGCESAIS